MAAAQQEAKKVSPVTFYKDAPFGVAGNKVSKDFGTRVEKITAEADDDADGDVTDEDPDGGTDTDGDTAPPTDAPTDEAGDADGEAGDTIPQVAPNNVDYEAQLKSDKPIEAVDAPVLNKSDDDDDVLEL